MLGASRVGGDGGDILDAANAEARAGEGAEGGLSAGAGVLGAGTTRSAELDVHGGDATSASLLRAVLSGKHGSVGGGLIAISLDLHATWKK